MIESIIASLTIFELLPADLERLGLPPGPLKLRRAWPRGPGQLALEYTTGNGGIIAGQWFDEAGQLERVAQAGPKPAAAVTSIAGMKVFLHAEGADRRLPGLAQLLAQPETQLLVHRSERRAVVRLKMPAGLRYAKVVRPKRTQALAAAGSVARNLAQRGGFAIPELLETDVETGLTVWSELPGVSLHELLGRDRLISATRAMGRTLRALHDTSPPANIPTHSAADEIGVLQHWLTRLEAFAPDLGGQIRAVAPRVFEALAAASSPSVPLHRDFYDKQLLIDAEGRTGLLDFDTLAMGEAALDLANALVHFELRTLQGNCSPERATRAVIALLQGYQLTPSVYRRFYAYVNATRLRLACVYAFRPYGRPLVPLLLARVGRPVANTTVSVDPIF
ncbi:MAG: aminoglycoside phosphotransferase family protein, partial [Rhodobacteraceae bacterium]|nr:aminoglycoside phosphotransferase family protein [Paracoccaceae bacterium]